MLDFSIIEPLIENMCNNIFSNINQNELSNYEKRKQIFMYLCNSLEFDVEELNNKSGNYEKQILDVLIYNKGVCHSISYIYKIILERYKIYSLVLFCKDENDIHAINLVDNGDGTLSFDDLSLGIYSKKISGVGLSFEERFDYDIEDAQKMNQGIKDVRENTKYLILSSDFVNYILGKKDKLYKEYKPDFINEKEEFINIQEKVSAFKNQKALKKMIKLY